MRVLDADPATAASAEPAWRRGLELLGASSLAVAQPLLSTLGENPSVFESLDITGTRLVIFALGLVLAPPVLLWLVGEAIRAGRARAGRIWHRAVVQVLIALLLAQVLVRLDFGVGGVVGGLALSFGFVWLWDRFGGVRTWLQVLAALGAVAFVGFLGSDAGELIDPQPLTAVELDLPEPPADVFILVLDELPTATLLDDGERIDAARFPNLAAFADTSTWYRRHSTVSPFTEFAIPTLLTGRDPTDAAPFAAQYPDNLFTLFGDSHRLRVSEALTGLCGVPACTRDLGDDASTASSPQAAAPSPQWRRLVRTTWSLFGEKVGLTADDGALDDFEEEVVRAAPPASATDPGETVEPGVTTTFPPELERFLATRLGSQPRRFTEFLASLDAETDPMLGFLHLILPHQPWEFTADGTQYRTAALFNERIETLTDPWLLRINAARHVEQTRYTDGVVGEFLAALVAADRFDDALVVVMADHGIDFELGVHPRQVSTTTIDGVIYSPLLIKEPGQTVAEISDSNVHTFDVLPTIASILGVDVPWDVDGAPVGSLALEGRTAEKRYGDFIDPFDPKLNGIVTFDGDDVWRVALGDRNDDLYEDLDEAVLIGSPPAWTQATAIDVDLDLGPLTAPTGDDLPIGVVSGSIVESAGVAAMALVIDDEIVAVSPVYDLVDQVSSFALLVPPEHLGFAGVVVELAALVDGQAIRVTPR